MQHTRKLIRAVEAQYWSVSRRPVRARTAARSDLRCVDKHAWAIIDPHGVRWIAAPRLDDPYSLPLLPGGQEEEPLVEWRPRRHGNRRAPRRAKRSLVMGRRREPPAPHAFGAHIEVSPRRRPPVCVCEEDDTLGGASACRRRGWVVHRERSGESYVGDSPEPSACGAIGSRARGSSNRMTACSSARRRTAIC